MQDVELNGIARINEAINKMNHDEGNILPPAMLRRLARLHARKEGAESVAQVALNAAQAAQAALQQALNDACEEEGLEVPQGATAPVDINWATGRLRIRQGGV